VHSQACSAAKRRETPATLSAGLAEYAAHVEQLLTSQAQQGAEIEQFKDALSSLPELIGRPERPLIVIIDELDRCKPIFALQVLERVKHFFSVPNVQFVLGVHLAQLENSVRVTYGPDINAGLYLQKFIHVTTTLLDTGRHAHERIAIKYSAYLAQALEFAPKDKEFVQSARSLIARIAREREFSLRTIERIFGTLALAVASSHKDQLRPPPIVVGLCVLKVTHPEFYVKARKGEINLDDVRDPLAFWSTEEDRNTGKTGWMERIWRYVLERKVDNEEDAEGFRQLFARYDIDDPREVIPYVANTILDRFVPFGEQ
jgi:hypothetical protein